jgi:hypothetical protein
MSTAVVEVEGVVIEISPSLKNGLSALTASGSANGSATTRSVSRLNLDRIPEDETQITHGCRLWLRGKRLRTEDGELLIGDQRYGRVQPGDAVRIDSEGVHVNGEMRGGLPAE